jgi:hypothetical protein
MSDVQSVWHRKTDEEVQQALSAIGTYTIDGKAAVLAEAARRGIPVPAAVTTPVIESCSKCGRQIEPSGWETWCTRCGTPFPPDVAERRVPHMARQTNADAPPATPAVRCQHRYRDAYRVAGAVVGVGSAIKTASIVVGGLLAFCALIGFANTSIPLGFALVVFSGFLAMVGFVLGTLVSAQGQVLMAALDGAVNGSPFLSLEEKACAMGIQ